MDENLEIMPKVFYFLSDFCSLSSHLQGSMGINFLKSFIKMLFHPYVITRASISSWVENATFHSAKSEIMWRNGATPPRVEIRV